MQRLLAYDQERQYYKITQMLTDHYHRQWNVLQGQLSQWTAQQSEHLEQKRQQAAELKQWQTQSEPVWTWDEATDQHHQALKARNIPFCPLYEKLEFQTDCREEDRQRIEESLRRSGILDCILISEADRERCLEAELGQADKLLISQAAVADLPGRVDSGKRGNRAVGSAF